MDGCQALQPAELLPDGSELSARYVIISGYSLYVSGLVPIAVEQAHTVRLLRTACPSNAPKLSMTHGELGRGRALLRRVCLFLLAANR